MTVSLKTYEQIALEDGDEQWELACGRLRQKPAMTTDHNEVMSQLVGLLMQQLPRAEFAVRMNSTRLRVSTGSYYVPDVLVIPRSLIQRSRERPGRLEVYTEPLPLVVEVWSPSTGDYDVEIKLREYQLRGDAEIWRIQPYERSVTVWQRQPAGGYSERVHRSGLVQPASLPLVRIEVETLFE